MTTHRKAPLTSATPISGKGVWISDELGSVAATDGRAVGVLGWGSYVPSGVITNADLEALVDTNDDWIVSRTGIRERRQVAIDETAIDLGEMAGRRALAHAKLTAVDVVIVASSSTLAVMPSAACQIQERLGLTGAAALDLNAACSGFVYALTVAESLVRAGSARTVLIVATEAMTKLVNYHDRATCVLFGDGAGAMVVGSGPGTGSVDAVAWGADGREGSLIRYVGPLDTEEPGMRMEGKGTYRRAVERLCLVIERLCASAGWELSDVDTFIPHQANLRILEAAAQRLGVDLASVVVNVDRFGNTGGASIPLAIADAASRGILKPGAKVVCVAFGAGSTWGGAAFTWPEKGSSA